MSKLIIGLHDVNPADWESDAEFEQSIHRLGTGGVPTTPAERKLDPLVQTLLTIRDEIVNDVAHIATEKAVNSTQLSTMTIRAHVEDIALRRAGSKPDTATRSGNQVSDAFDRAFD